MQSQNKEVPPPCPYHNCLHRSESAVVARPSNLMKKGLRLGDGCKSCLLFLRRRRPKPTPPTLVKTTRQAPATVVYIGRRASQEATRVTLHRTGEKFDRSDDITRKNHSVRSLPPKNEGNRKVMTITPGRTSSGYARRDVHNQQRRKRRDPRLR